MFSPDACAFICSHSAPDILHYEVLPRTILAKGSFLGLREIIHSSPCDGFVQLLLDATLKGYIDVVRLLLTYEQVDPAAMNNAAIINAGRNGYIDVVKLLLTYEQVDPAARDNKAIN